MTSITEWYNWLITSSADPENTSATVKGALKIFAAQVIHAATVACTLGVACALGDLSWLNSAADFAGVIVYAVLLFWGAAQGIYGLWRKYSLGRWSHPAA